MSAEAEQLMKEAWRERREALELDGPEQEKSFGTARQKLKKAIELAELPGLEAQATHLLANVELDCGNHDEAVSLWESAVVTFRELGDPAHLAHKIRHLAMAYDLVGRTGEAAACYESSVALYREHEDSSSQDYANAALAYARHCIENDRADDARSLFEEAMRQYESAGFPDGVDYCRGQLDALNIIGAQ